MAGFDFRTKPETADTMSFYIFDNLKMQETGEGGNVYRFDTMQQAIVGFRMIQAEHPDWTIALGGSVAGEREIDFVHRREGWMNVLVGDYKRIPFWADRSDVAQAIREFAEGPGIDWQTDRELLGGPVLIPYAPEGEHSDPYLTDKALMPSDGETPIKGVAEAYVQGSGWVSFDELKQMIADHGRDPDSRPRVSRLNVAYETMGKDGGELGRTGYVDIEPHEMRGMADRFRELRDIRDQEREERLAAEERVNPPVPDSVLPDTGQPFFDFETLYAETEKINIGLGMYQANDNLYVGMNYYDRDLKAIDFFGDITVSVTKLQPFMACIDVNNNGPKVMDFLVKNGFGEPTGRSLPSGFCMYPVFRFSPEKLREADPRGFEQYCKLIGIDARQQAGKDSLDDLKKQANERAQDKNIERPDRQPSKDRDMER